MENFSQESKVYKIEVADTPQSDERGPAIYEYLLGVSLEEMSGKKVLNIGSGRKGLLEKELMKRKTSIITISPYFMAGDVGGEQMREAYTKRSIGDKLKKKLGFDKGEIYPVASRVEEGIPLANNSLDYVLALYSVPLYLSADENVYLELIREVDRVLQEGGRASFFPIPEKQKEDFGKIFENLKLDYDFIQVDELGGANDVYIGEKTYRLTFKK